MKRPDDAPDKTGAKSAVGVPLMARDELVGVMTLVHSDPGSFTESHTQLMQAISDQARKTRKCRFYGQQPDIQDAVPQLGG